MHSTAKNGPPGDLAAPLLVSIDGTSILHAVAEGDRRHPLLVKAALEEPNCSGATHDSRVEAMRSFTPGRSAGCVARPQRRENQHRG